MIESLAYNQNQDIYSKSWDNTKLSNHFDKNDNSDLNFEKHNLKNNKISLKRNNSYHETEKKNLQETIKKKEKFHKNFDIKNLLKKKSTSHSINTSSSPTPNNYPINGVSKKKSKGNLSKHLKAKALMNNTITNNEKYNLNSSKNHNYSISDIKPSPEFKTAVHLLKSLIENIEDENDDTCYEYSEKSFTDSISIRKPSFNGIITESLNSPSLSEIDITHAVSIISTKTEMSNLKHDLERYKSQTKRNITNNINKSRIIEKSNSNKNKFFGKKFFSFFNPFNWFDSQKRSNKKSSNLSPITTADYSYSSDSYQEQESSSSNSISNNSIETKDHTDNEKSEITLVSLKHSNLEFTNINNDSFISKDSSNASETFISNSPKIRNNDSSSQNINNKNPILNEDIFSDNANDEISLNDRNSVNKDKENNEIENKGNNVLLLNVPIKIENNNNGDDKNDIEKIFQVENFDEAHILSTSSPQLNNENNDADVEKIDIKTKENKNDISIKSKNIDEYEDEDVEESSTSSSILSSSNMEILEYETESEMYHKMNNNYDSEIEVEIISISSPMADSDNDSFTSTDEPSTTASNDETADTNEIKNIETNQLICNENIKKFTNTLQENLNNMDNSMITQIDIKENEYISFPTYPIDDLEEVPNQNNDINNDVNKETLNSDNLHQNSTGNIDSYSPSLSNNNSNNNNNINTELNQSVIMPHSIDSPIISVSDKNVNLNQNYISSTINEKIDTSAYTLSSKSHNICSTTQTQTPKLLPLNKNENNELKSKPPSNIVNCNNNSVLHESYNTSVITQLLPTTDDINDDEFSKTVIEETINPKNSLNKLNFKNNNISSSSEKKEEKEKIQENVCIISPEKSLQSSNKINKKMEEEEMTVYVKEEIKEENEKVDINLREEIKEENEKVNINLREEIKEEEIKEEEKIKEEMKIDTDINVEEEINEEEMKIDTNVKEDIEEKNEKVDINVNKEEVKEENKNVNISINEKEEEVKEVKIIKEEMKVDINVKEKEVKEEEIKEEIIEVEIKEEEMKEEEIKKVEVKEEEIKKDEIKEVKEVEVKEEEVKEDEINVDNNEKKEEIKEEIKDDINVKEVKEESVDDDIHVKEKIEKEKIDTNVKKVVNKENINVDANEKGIKETPINDDKNKSIENEKIKTTEEVKLPERNNSDSIDILSENATRKNQLKSVLKRRNRHSFPCCASPFEMTLLTHIPLDQIGDKENKISIPGVETIVVRQRRKSVNFDRNAFEKVCYFTSTEKPKDIHSRDVQIKEDETSSNSIQTLLNTEVQKLLSDEVTGKGKYSNLGKTTESLCASPETNEINNNTNENPTILSSKLTIEPDALATLNIPSECKNKISIESLTSLTSLTSISDSISISKESDSSESNTLSITIKAEIEQQIKNNCLLQDSSLKLNDPSSSWSPIPRNVIHLPKTKNKSKDWEPYIIIESFELAPRFEGQTQDMWDVLEVKLKVQNLDYHKKVFIRYTTNDWKSYKEEEATYSCCIREGIQGQNNYNNYGEHKKVGLDRFIARIDASEFFVLPDCGRHTCMQRPTTMLLVARYEVLGTTYWDNNHFTDYKLELVRIPAGYDVPRPHGHSKAGDASIIACAACAEEKHEAELANAKKLLKEDEKEKKERTKVRHFGGGKALLSDNFSVMNPSAKTDFSVDPNNIYAQEVMKNSEVKKEISPSKIENDQEKLNTQTTPSIQSVDNEKSNTLLSDTNSSDNSNSSSNSTNNYRKY